MNQLKAILKDLKRDEKWIEYYKKAAELNDSNSLYNLGVIYEAGNGEPTNSSKAKEYYEKAEKLNNSNALVNLGLMYEEGHGVPINYLKVFCFIPIPTGKIHKNFKILFQKNMVVFF